MESSNRNNPELNKGTSKLDFLYNRISMPRVCMAAWLRVPELVEKITALDSEGISITDEVFLKTAEPILYDKQLNRRENQELRIPTLKRGLNHIRKNISDAKQ